MEQEIQSPTMMQRALSSPKRLYDWTVAWADKPYGLWALAILSFAESSFFPIPPDVLLIPLVFGAPKKWWRVALVCTVASVFGALLGWYIGHVTWEYTHDFFFKYVPGFTPELFDSVSSKFHQYEFWAVLGAAALPIIPYKIFTIAAGVCNISIPSFILASILGRGSRFFGVAIIIYFVGPRAKPFIEKYFNLLLTIFFVLLVGGFVIVKYIV